ncbi:hypothetical protein ACTJIJ_22310 [Niabella sp. 22666]|uniref:hypothetical protein n=1 Tax=Niabella sp. 22666 TaxID=3453954 RepID=UPI003F85C6F5
MIKKLTTMLLLGSCTLTYGQNVFPTNGNVGIGTSTPFHKLTIDPDGPGGILIGAGGGGTGNYTQLLMTISAKQFGYASIDAIKSSGDQYGDIILNRYNGKVGVGTTAPVALLDVGRLLNNGALTTALARQNEGNEFGDGTFLGTRAWETQNVTYNGKAFSLEHGFYGNTNSCINFYRGGGATGGHIRFATNNGTEQMIIDAYGKVGIGTMTPTEGYRLTVAGKIIGKELKIQDVPGWADFVFLPSYRLRSLAEVEAHIKDKGHLPDVPSADDIKKNEGYELGRMDATLLKKIEELTLYAIKMEKEIKNLQSESASLKEENSRLRNNILLRLEQLEKQPAKGN